MFCCMYACKISIPADPGESKMLLTKMFRVLTKTLETANLLLVLSIKAFKIIILDDANSMTEDAQNALCHTMKTYSDTDGKY
ncbi:hypothetical protein Lser_V15G05273 [Lactuca serriola]